jgi:hypothetical protein
MDRTIGLEENSPKAIDFAFSHNFDVEIDIRYDSNEFVLGHDKGLYKVNRDFLLDRSSFLWCHAKDLKTLAALLDLNLNCFFHNTDDGVLTSHGYIWTYPGKELTVNSIAVLPELNENWDLTNCFGICTDYPNKWRER